MNKKYPEEFFFSSLQPSTVWSESPKQNPWQLDIHKSIRGSKLYWKTITRAQTGQKKKKILLSDFIRLDSTHPQFTFYRHGVNELLADHFEVFVMGPDDRLVKLNPNNWNNKEWYESFLSKCHQVTLFDLAYNPLTTNTQIFDLHYWLQAPKSCSQHI